MLSAPVARKTENGKLIALASALSRRNEVCDPSSASVIR